MISGLRGWVLGAVAMIALACGDSGGTGGTGGAGSGGAGMGGAGAGGAGAGGGAGTGGAAGGGGAGAGGSAGAGGEDSSGAALVKPYAGTWNVMATTGMHTRGTVVVSAAGDLDFDTGKTFTVAEYQGVYDRLTVMDSEGGGRIQVEIKPSGSTPQRRIRIFVDPATRKPKGFSYYPDVTSANPDANKTAVTVTGP